MTFSGYNWHIYVCACFDRGYLESKGERGGKDSSRTAFALAKEEKLDDLCLLSESFLALDVFVNFVTYPPGFRFVCKPLQLVLRGLVGGRLEGGCEGVWGVSYGHSCSS